MSVDEFFEERRKHTNDFLQRWGDSFRRHLGEDGQRALDDGKCVYAVGSAGRGEIGKDSDLDVFLVTTQARTRIEETLIQAAVIRAMDEFDLPKPSNDAAFLTLFESSALRRHLGKINDDPDNTFTVRMLLLLESSPIANPKVYDSLVSSVVEEYWRNAEAHATDYLPMVLVNDIVRYWRVLLLNYEAKHADKSRDAIDKGEDARRDALAKKRIAGQKLRFSRSMTCYSMIARLLLESRKDAQGGSHVARDAVIKMVRETPSERLEYVKRHADDDDASHLIDELLELYRDYLVLKDQGEQRLIEIFVGDERKPLVAKADRFGQALFELVEHLGKRSPLYRYVVV